MFLVIWPASSLLFFYFGVLTRDYRLLFRWLNWVLRSSLWFGHFRFSQWLWLNILYNVVLLMLRQIADVRRILVQAFISLFQTFCVPECVNCMIRRRRPRVNARNHNNLRLLFCKERVSQHHRELGGSKRNVVTLHVQCSDAFFECQQTFVDLCTFQSSLTVVTLAVSCSFRSCQID